MHHGQTRSGREDTPPARTTVTAGRDDKVRCPRETLEDGASAANLMTDSTHLGKGNRLQHARWHLARAVALHVIALARVVAIALDPVRGLVAAVCAELVAGAAERAPHPLMARCAFCRQVASLVRTDTQGLGAVVFGAICVLARQQDARLPAAVLHGGDRSRGRIARALGVECGMGEVSF